MATHEDSEFYGIFREAEDESGLGESDTNARSKYLRTFTKFGEQRPTGAASDEYDPKVAGAVPFAYALEDFGSTAAGTAIYRSRNDKADKEKTADVDSLDNMLKELEGQEGLTEEQRADIRMFRKNLIQTADFDVSVVPDVAGRNELITLALNTVLKIICSSSRSYATKKTKFSNVCLLMKARPYNTIEQHQIFCLAFMNLLCINSETNEFDPERWTLTKHLAMHGGKEGKLSGWTDQFPEALGVLKDFADLEAQWKEDKKSIVKKKEETEDQRIARAHATKMAYLTLLKKSGTRILDQEGHLFDEEQVQDFMKNPESFNEVPSLQKDFSMKQLAVQKRWVQEQMFARFFDNEVPAYSLDKLNEKAIESLARGHREASRVDDLEKLVLKRAHMAKRTMTKYDPMRDYIEINTSKDPKKEKLVRVYMGKDSKVAKWVQHIQDGDVSQADKRYKEAKQYLGARHALNIADAVYQNTHAKAPRHWVVSDLQAQQTMDDENLGLGDGERVKRALRAKLEATEGKLHSAMDPKDALEFREKHPNANLDGGEPNNLNDSARAVMAAFETNPALNRKEQVGWRDDVTQKRDPAQDAVKKAAPGEKKKPRTKSKRSKAPVPSPDPAAEARDQRRYNRANKSAAVRRQHATDGMEEKEVADFAPGAASNEHLSAMPTAPDALPEPEDIDLPPDAATHEAAATQPSPPKKAKTAQGKTVGFQSPEFQSPTGQPKEATPGPQLAKSPSQPKANLKKKSNGPKGKGGGQSKGKGGGQSYNPSDMHYLSRFNPSDFYTGRTGFNAYGDESESDSDSSVSDSSISDGMSDGMSDIDPASPLGLLNALY